jgi:hypothetical protein
MLIATWNQAVKQPERSQDTNLATALGFFGHCLADALPECVILPNNTANYFTQDGARHMADEKMCPNCSTPMQSGADAFVPISAGFREISFPVHIYECPQCHLVQLYAAGRRV